MKKKIGKILIFTFAFFIPIRLSFAQQVSKELEEVVVTATKMPQKLEKIPGKVEVITEEELKNFYAPNFKIDDLLQYLSTTSVVRTQGIFSLGAQATLRGLSNEQARTLVLIDGIPINKSDTGEVNFNRININDIERIEILRGPASAIYGNNAMGGVINIITKRPVKPFSGFLEGFYGTYDTYGGNYEIMSKPFKDKGLYFKFSGHYLDSDGYISKPEKTRTPYTTERFVEEFIGSFLLGYEIGKDHLLEFKVDYYDDRRGEGEKIFYKYGVSREFDTYFYSLLYKGNYGDRLKWQIKGFWQKENYQRVSEIIRRGSYIRFDVDSDRIDKGFDSFLSWKVASNHFLSMGFDYRLGSVDASDIYKTSLDRADNQGKLKIWGIWLQDEISFLKERLNFLVNLRYDKAKYYDGEFYSTLRPFNLLSGKYPSKSWDSFSPRIGVKYIWTSNFVSYVSYSKGFRASILDDLCRSGIMWGIYKIANPNLKPEKIYSFELGFDYFPFSSLGLSASFYYSLGKDFLYYVPTGETLDGRALYKRENIGKVKSYGAEFSLNYFPRKDLKISLIYLLNKAYIDEFKLNPSLEGKELTRTPRSQIKGSIVWNTPYVNLGLLGIYKSSQYVYTNEPRYEIQKLDSYILLNGKLWKTFNIGSKKIEASLNVENIFNERYTESIEEKNPGRFINFSLKFEF